MMIIEYWDEFHSKQKGDCSCKDAESQLLKDMTLGVHNLETFENSRMTFMYKINKKAFVNYE